MMAMGSVRIPEEGNGTVRPLRVDPSRCSRMRYSGSRCERCVSACPRSAIRLDECLDVLEERCTGCLTCTTVCPAGALEAEADFDRLIRGLASHPLPTLVVGCGKSGSPSDRQLPCLGMLSAEHLVALSASGEAIVQLDASACNGCDAGGMYQHLTARLRKTEEESGLPLGSRIRLIPEAGRPGNDHGAGSAVHGTESHVVHGQVSADAAGDAARRPGGSFPGDCARGKRRFFVSHRLRNIV